MQGRQEFGVLDHPFGTALDGVWGEAHQAFQPQLFDLVEHRGVAVGLVILVVVIDAKQRKNAVQGIDMGLGGLGLLLSL